MKRLIPSTSMLVAFDAAARHGSFTRAAHEINLTPGAVNRQVTALEQQLSIKLFTRIQKQLELTNIGKKYAAEVYSVLLALRNASLNAISSPLCCSLNLGILPTFGTRWLMPRFPGFLDQNPDMTVNFVTKLSPFEFSTEDVDAAIHFGKNDWPGTECTYLMGEESVPVCAPALLPDPLNTKASEICQLPLLRLESRPEDWETWFSMNGLDISRSPGGMLFEQFSIITQAAVAGLGAALLPKFLIQRELERGELLMIIDKPLKSSLGYYLVSPAEKTKHPPVVAFREWLQTTICDG